MDPNRIESIVAEQSRRPGALLPILHAVQEAYGFIPPDSIPLIAHGLNISRAEVYGVITFYADFRQAPPGRHVVQICRGESCQAMGGADLEALAKQTLGVDYHQTSRDDAVTLEPVYCLGNCACSPAVRVGDDILGRVDGERLQALLQELRREKVR